MSILYPFFENNIFSKIKILQIDPKTLLLTIFMVRDRQDFFFTSIAPVQARFGPTSTQNLYFLMFLTILGRSCHGRCALGSPHALGIQQVPMVEPSAMSLPYRILPRPIGRDHPSAPLVVRPHFYMALAYVFQKVVFCPLASRRGLFLTKTLILKKLNKFLSTFIQELLMFFKNLFFLPYSCDLYFIRH